MKVHVAVSRDSEIEKAASNLSKAVKEALGPEKVHLVFVVTRIAPKGLSDVFGKNSIRM
jgi:hypothetical protein